MTTAAPESSTTGTEAAAGGEDGGAQPTGTFTQSDVDRIVADRLARERSKYADYDDLKQKAGQLPTLEERVAATEKRATDAEAAALRSNIATQHGITAEDRDLFLTGSDETTLTAQAERLKARDAASKASGNHVPTEGANPQPKTDDMREFVRDLFARATAD